MCPSVYYGRTRGANHFTMCTRSIFLVTGTTEVTIQLTNLQNSRNGMRCTLNVKWALKYESIDWGREGSFQRGASWTLSFQKENEK